MPTISVLVTIYNREAYLAETLQSILASTYHDFEVIAVDDASSDRSLEIARDFSAIDDRIRIVANEDNLGDYGNRMKAASLARGAYIKYVDSDDLIYPHTLDVMVRSMQRYSDAAVGLSHSIPEDESPYPWRLTPSEAYRKHFLGRGCMSCGPSSAMIRRDAFDSVKGFRKKWGVLSDMDLWFRLSAKYPIILLPPGLAWWRRHDGQEFTKDDAMEVYMCLGHELEIQALEHSDCPLSAADCEAALARKRQHHARRLLGLALRSRQFSLATRLFRNSRLSLADLASGMRRYQ